MSRVAIEKKAVVDTDNNFKVLGVDFLLPLDNKEYKVLKKAGSVDEYENESRMDTVTVKIDQDLYLKFYDEEGREIHGVELKK